MKVPRMLATMLRDLGVAAVFGVMGDGNMHWLAEYAALPGGRWCPAWHEAGAVGMADGYARAAVGRTVGVATVTMGPGLAQALGALTAAVRTRSPVLVITAETAHRSPADAQDVGQRSWAETAGAQYRLVTDAADLGTALTETMRSAADGCPTVLALAVGLMNKKADWPPPPELDLATPADHARPIGQAGPVAAATGPPCLDGSTATAADLADPGAAAIEAAARLLAGSRRPLVLLGRGAEVSGAVPAAVALGRRIGACFVTTVPAKGCLATACDPFDLGLAGTMAHPPARAVAATADVVLVVGAALDQHNTAGGTFFGDARVIRVDRRPADRMWRPDGDVAELTGDAGVVLARLAASAALAAGDGDSLEPGTEPGLSAAETTAPPAGDGAGFEREHGLRTARTAALLAADPSRRAALAATEPGDGLNPWAVIAAIDDALPDQAHVVTGVGHFWYFAVPYLSARPGRTFQFGYGFGLIGQGLPLAIGAAVASPIGRPTVAIEGDGSFLMNPQELQSAVRFGVDLLVLVLNNEAYGSEYHKLAIAGLDPAAGAFDRPADIVAVAVALGADARRVTTMGELRAGLAAFAPAGGVRVLDIDISPSVMSEAYQRMHLPSASSPTGAHRGAVQ